MLHFSLGPSAGTRGNLQQRRSHARARRVPSRRGLRHETGRPWNYHASQEAHCFATSPAEIFTTAAVPGRSAALDVCVASSIAAAARGDAAQAAFDRFTLQE